MAKPQKCSKCGKENDPSFAFCLDCGQSLRSVAAPVAGERICNSCGARLSSEFRFCGHCGRPVDQTAGAPPPPPPISPPVPRIASPAKISVPVYDPGRAPAAPAEPARAAPPPPFPPPRPPSQEFATAVRPVVASSSPFGAPGSSGAHVTVIRRDGQPGPSVVLGNGEVICGRAEGELLIRDDPSVSPRHARFSLEPGGVQVTDLGSVNGTFLRLRVPCTLVPGDEIRVGRQFLRLEPVPRPASAPNGSDDDSTPWGSPDRGARLRLAQLLDGGGVGEIYPLEPGENFVGREVGSILFSQDRYVSGRHCKVEVNESGVTVTDLGSSNGTFVRIKGSAPLQTGDQILIGMQLLRFDA